MDTLEVVNFTGFHNRVHMLYQENPLYIFRGLSNVDYPLISSLGRCFRKLIDEGHSSREELLEEERNAYRLFKTEAVALIEREPKSAIQWLALMQHYGLPTRLLDWTLNPLVALYFAVRSNPQGDAVVYVNSFERDRWLHGDDDAYAAIDRGGNDIFSIENPYYFFPSGLDKRFGAQQGLFSIQADPMEVFPEGNLTKIVIKQEARIEIRLTLMKYGITPRTVFPGLSGIAETIVWDKFRIHR